MIRSMTGFGEAVAHVGQWSVRVRVRTLNNRGLRTNFHFPEEFSWRAPEMRKLVREYFRRGTIDVWLHIVSEAAAESVVIDGEVARAYAEELRKLQSDLGLAGAVDVSTVVNLPGVMRGVELEATDELWKAAVQAVKDAAGKAVAMRRVEGEALAKELSEICLRLEAFVEEAEEKAAGVVEGYKERLLARLRGLTEGEELPLTEQDVMREIVVFADRSDITEELCRLESHISMFREALGSEGAEGRRLEFMAQEMLREANTLAAKANDATLSQISVSLRAEVERIKEQVGNVE